MLRSDSEREVNEVTERSVPRQQSLHSLRFPNKLWRIVNDCRTGAITWSNDGKSIVIDYTKFQLDYLTNQLGIFKTCNINSFIRQLNLYGFRKVSPHDRTTVRNQYPGDIHLFRNDSFLRDRPDLLQNVTRKTGPLSIREVRRRPEPKPRPSHGLHPQDSLPTPRSASSGQHVSQLSGRSRNSGPVNGAIHTSDDPWPTNAVSCAGYIGGEFGDNCYQGCCRSAVERPGLDIHQIMDPSKSPKRVCLGFEDDNYSLQDFFELESFSGEPLGEVYDMHGTFSAQEPKVSSPGVPETDEKDLLSTALQLEACFQGTSGPEDRNSDETPSDWNQLSLMAAGMADYGGLSTQPDVEGCTAVAANFACVSQHSSSAKAGSTTEKGTVF